MVNEKDLSKRDDLDNLESADKSALRVDETLLQLNEEIHKAFESYFTHTSITLRFDIPDKDTPPDRPTICIFLYDIQEDLQLRHGLHRNYDVGKASFNAAQVHVRCCYLITYWETKTTPETSFGPRSQSMIVMNLVLNALLNLKLTTVPTFKRVIAPSEHLSSLGNFWQALGNKPRLCLNFTVTVPVNLNTRGTKDISTVLSTESKVIVSNKAADALVPADQLADVLQRRLTDGLRKNGGSLAPEALDAQLASIKVTCWLAADSKSTLEAGPWDGQVSGLLEEKLHQSALTIIANWNSESPVEDVKFRSFDTQSMIGISTKP